VGTPAKQTAIYLFRLKCSIRGEVNKKHFAFGRIFVDFQPSLVIEQDLFSLSAPKARDAADNRVALVGFLPAVFILDSRRSQ
jgi:hypothetical protein